MKEFNPPVLGYADVGGKSVKAAVVVIVATGETWGNVLLNLQAKLESTTVMRPEAHKEIGKPPMLFTPLE